MNKSQKIRILIAEDNKINRMVLSKLLKKKGYESEEVTNGEEAVSHWESNSFHLILMDVQMPIMDGIEATKQIREKEKSGAGRIPIIALTAHSMDSDTKSFMEAGMDAHITKPIEKEVLYTTIESFF